MPSIRGRIAHILVKAAVKHWPCEDPPALVRRARRVFGQPKLLGFRQARVVDVKTVDGVVRGEWLEPSNVRLPDSVLLYFHGGGYVSCSPNSHSPITAALARLIGCRVFSLDYRLAPEHPFPAAADDALRSYYWLLESGIKRENIAVAGDSAGGGLVISTLVRLRDRGTALPACAATIAPWVDLRVELPCTNEKSCAMFFPADARAFARIYLNGASAESLIASPLLADLSGLPALLIQVGDKELLYDDAVRLHEKAEASAVQSRLHIYTGLPHVWHMLTGVVPEADQALKEIAEFVHAKLAAESFRRLESIKTSAE